MDGLLITRILKFFSLTLMMTLMLSLFGCGESADVVPEEESRPDNTDAVNTYYRENPDRFVFSSLEDLPADLDWQDGADLPEFHDPEARRGGRLMLRINTMQQTLRVHGPDANSTLRGPLWSANMVYLIHRHPWADGYIPGVAREWAVSPDDPRTVYFKLDPDARWSDGKPFTADDVVFSLYLLLSPHLQAPAINRVFDEGITRVTRFDEYTVAITQTKPTPDPLFALSTYILSQQDFYRELGEDYVDRYHWRFAPVTGAYVLDEDSVRRGRQISFRRVEDWWADDKPFYRQRFNPDMLTFTVVRDDTKAFEMFLKGEIDWHFLNRTPLWYDHADHESIAGGYIRRAQVYHELPAARDGVYMNAMHPRLENQALREAIAYAINYDRVNEGLYRGDRRRIRSFVDGYGEYSHPDLRARPYDPERAEQLFAEAGYTTRGGDGVLVNAEGDRLSFLLTVANRSDEVTRAEIIKEAARQAGLELLLDVLDPTAFFTKTFEKNHQIAIHGWNTGYSPLPAFEWELRGADAGKPSNFNTTNIKDAELDALLAEWDGIADPVRARQISHQVQERIHAFAAWVPGLTLDYDRFGYWRWLQWPDYFQIPRYFFFIESGVFWIDEEMRTETLDAMEKGETFPADVEYFERWKRE